MITDLHQDVRHNWCVSYCKVIKLDRKGSKSQLLNLRRDLYPKAQEPVTNEVGVLAVESVDNNVGLLKVWKCITIGENYRSCYGRDRFVGARGVELDGILYRYTCSLQLNCVLLNMWSTMSMPVLMSIVSWLHAYIYDCGMIRTCILFIYFDKFDLHIYTHDTNNKRQCDILCRNVKHFCFNPVLLSRHMWTNLTLLHLILWLFFILFYDWTNFDRSLTPWQGEFLLSCWLSYLHTHIAWSN